MDDDEPPPLEDESMETEEYPDYELIETKPRHVAVSQSKELTDDLHKFIIQCLPRAVSVIKSEQLTDGQTDRLQLVKRLLTDSQGEFTKQFMKHTHALLTAQDENRVRNWVKADAAKASNMKESETLRHALEDSLERAFVPALAAVIAFTDVRENIQLLNSNSPLVPLWMEIFTESHKLGLTFERLTRHNQSASSKLPDSYKIQEVGKGRQQFQVSCPFSWLAKDEIDKIASAPSQAHIHADTEMLIEQFNQTPIGQIIGGVEEITLYEQLFRAYITDYGHMVHPCMSSSEHWIVVDSIMRVMQREYGGAGRFSLVHVHLAFDLLKDKCERLSAILEFSANYPTLPDQVVQLMKEDNSSDDVVKPFDLMALSLLLDSISKISLVDLQKNSKRWVLEVDMCKMIVSRVMDSYQRDEDWVDLQQQCQQKWLLLAIKKLYVFNVIVPTEADAHGKKKSFKLVFFMRTVKKTDFHTREAFAQVVEALQKSVAGSVRLLYPNCPTRCPGCHDSLDSPAQLPCEHFLCDNCVGGLTLCVEQGCGREIPDGYEYSPSASDIDQEKIAEFKAFRGRLNKFFMSFVSELVFGNYQDPEDEVIRWLLNCITYGTANKTRQFSFFNSMDVIDPTPVLRSFLLKLLLQCNQTKSVTLHLNTILSQWTVDKTYQMHTFVLFIDCWKDVHSKYLYKEQDDLVRRLQAVMDRILPDGRAIDVGVLIDLAVVQSTISQLVTLLFKDDGNNPRIMRDVGGCLREMLNRSRRADNRQPGYLIARQIFKEHGEAQLKDLLNTPLNYLIPEAVKQDLESFTVPDVLSVYGGQHYKDIKAALDELIVESGSVDGFANAINQFKEVVTNRDTNLLLQVVFTRVTRTLVQNTPVSEDIRNELTQQLLPLLQPQQQELLKMFVQANLLPREMDLSSSRGLQLSMLVLHIYTCLGRPADVQPFLGPLAEIVNQPLQAADHFLPTMADSQLATQMANIKKLMPGETPTVYKCANGHIYVIGNCGRPVEASTCKEPGCGAPIGSTGAYNVAAAGAVKVNETSSEFKSKPGHILGASANRPGPHPERELNSLSCAVLRCLTHLSLYTASLFNKQQLRSVIHPPLANDDLVQPFIDAHIHLDIRHISQCCSLNLDECMLLVHDVIDRMSRDNQGGQAIAALTTIQQRSQWEQEFDTRYIKPTFTGDLVLKVQTIRDKLRTADSVDVRRLLSTHDKPVNDRNILASAGLWSYRQPLTLPALQNLLHNNLRVTNLTKLVDRCGQLVAVSYLPHIVQLLKLFDNEFHSTFSRQEAANTRMDHFWQKHRDTTPQLKELVHSFIYAWNIFLKYTAGEEELVNLNWSSPVGMFLYDTYAKQGGTSSIGTAAYRLVDFLTAAHNSMFLDDPDRPVIALTAVNSSNIVSVSGDEEILSLVECQSEYEIRGETKVKYNWLAIEREVLHRYIGNKPRIHLSRDQLPSFVFQEDFNLHNQMEAIDSSQMCMTRALQASVVTLLPPRIPKLKEHLKDLEILINFMSRKSYIEGDNSLSEYAEVTFGKRTEYLSKEIKLKHIKHVWLTIKYTQADLLMRQHQEPFGDIDPQYTDVIDNQLSDALKRVCTFNSPKTKVLLEELFKYILLRLNKAAVKQRHEEPEQTLQENLTGFIQFTTNDEDEERAYGLLEELPALPSEVHVKHASSAWRFIWTRHTTPTG